MVGVSYRYLPATDSPDLPVVRQWVERNPGVGAQLSETTEHGGGRVVLAISIPDHDEMVRAGDELPTLVRFPDLLRFRRWHPSEQEAEWTLQWVLGLMRRQEELDVPANVTSTGPHPVSGLIMISLDRVDRNYAAELERRGDGLILVLPQPVNPMPLSAAVSNDYPARHLKAQTPTWVTTEKPRANY
jgi:hypothetical protein